MPKILLFPLTAVVSGLMLCTKIQADQPTQPQPKKQPITHKTINTNKPKTTKAVPKKAEEPAPKPTAEVTAPAKPAAAPTTAATAKAAPVSAPKPAPTATPAAAPAPKPATTAPAAVAPKPAPLPTVAVKPTPLVAAPVKPATQPITAPAPIPAAAKLAQPAAPSAPAPVMPSRAYSASEEYQMYTQGLKQAAPQPPASAQAPVAKPTPAAVLPAPAAPAPKPTAAAPTPAIAQPTPLAAAPAPAKPAAPSAAPTAPLTPEAQQAAYFKQMAATPDRALAARAGAMQAAQAAPAPAPGAAPGTPGGRPLTEAEKQIFGMSPPPSPAGPAAPTGMAPVTPGGRPLTEAERQIFAPTAQTQAYGAAPSVQQVMATQAESQQKYEELLKTNPAMAAAAAEGKRAEAAAIEASKPKKQESFFESIGNALSDVGSKISSAVDVPFDWAAGAAKTALHETENIAGKAIEYSPIKAIGDVTGLTGVVNKIGKETGISNVITTAVSSAENLADKGIDLTAAAGKGTFKAMAAPVLLPANLGKDLQSANFQNALLQSSVETFAKPFSDVSSSAASFGTEAASSALKQASALTNAAGQITEATHLADVGRALKISNITSPAFSNIQKAETVATEQVQHYGQPVLQEAIKGGTQGAMFGPAGAVSGFVVGGASKIADIATSGDQSTGKAFGMNIGGAIGQSVLMGIAEGGPEGIAANLAETAAERLAAQAAEKSAAKVATNIAEQQVAKTVEKQAAKAIEQEAATTVEQQTAKAAEKQTSEALQKVKTIAKHAGKGAVAGALATTAQEYIPQDSTAGKVLSQAAQMTAYGALGGWKGALAGAATGAAQGGLSTSDSEAANLAKNALYFAPIIPVLKGSAASRAAQTAAGMFLAGAPIYGEQPTPQGPAVTVKIVKVPLKNPAPKGLNLVEGKKLWDKFNTLTTDSDQDKFMKSITKEQFNTLMNYSDWSDSNQ